MGEEEGGGARPCDEAASLCNCAAAGSAGELGAAAFLLDVRLGVALCELRCRRAGEDMVVVLRYGC